MNITLYTNNSEPIVVDKDLTLIRTVSGELKKETSIINPVILFEMAIETAQNFNYMYIEELNRYYYVTDAVSVRNGLVEVSARIDVLMTYADAIKQNTGIIERQQKEYDLYLNDNEFSIENRRTITTKNFPQGFTTGDNFFLTVVGGYYDTESEG